VDYGNVVNVMVIIAEPVVYIGAAAMGTVLVTMAM
jgi:hypothetical protein